MRILHLIHETAFGGVEAAAEELRQAIGSGRPETSLPSAADDGQSVRYRVAALERSADEIVHADVVGRGINDPRSVLRLLREIRREQPDVLVTSLWRAVALGFAARVLSPRTRWVVWIHLSRYTHAPDRLVHQAALLRADAIMCDSEAAYSQLIQPYLARKGRATPVHIVRPESAPLTITAQRRAITEDEPLRMLFWGRLARQKRLDLALDLLAELNAIRPGGATLTVTGPDAGELDALTAHAAELGVSDRVSFEPPADHDQIARLASESDVFVQLSDAEGFARSAHEALGAGLICVLTPVGDLAHDTRDGHDALHHHSSIADTAQRLTSLMADPVARERMSARARATAGEGFVQTFVSTCRTVRDRDA